MKLKSLLTENDELKRDVVHIQTRLKANSALMQLLSRINTTDELTQTLTTIIAFVDKSASYNVSNILTAVRDQLKHLKSDGPSNEPEKYPGYQHWKK